MGWIGSLESNGTVTSSNRTLLIILRHTHRTDRLYGESNQ